MKRGTILLETMIALCLLMVCILISLGICKSQMQATTKRHNKELINEALYAICSEIRYNIEFDDIQNKFIQGCICIKYDDDFINKLEHEDLLDIDSDIISGNYVKVEKEDSSEDSMKIKIYIKYNEISVDKILIKSKWMDEV